MYIDVVTTGTIRDRLYLEDLRNIRLPPVSIAEQALVSEMVRRAEEDTRELLSSLANQNAKVIGRIHGLVDASGAYSSAPGNSDDLKSKFRSLAEQWRRETGPFSSISRKTKHPAYQKIIAMGEPAIPLILRELHDRPAHWFVALKTIAGSSPVTEGADVSRATAAWLRWGREHGYLD